VEIWTADVSARCVHGQQLAMVSSKEAKRNYNRQRPASSTAHAHEDAQTLCLHRRRERMQDESCTSALQPRHEASRRLRHGLPGNTTARVTRLHNSFLACTYVSAFHELPLGVRVDA
jgi:hypothetical protein